MGQNLGLGINHTFLFADFTTLLLAENDASLLADFKTYLFSGYKDSGYFLAFGGSFELEWNIDTKLDSIDIEIYYSGEYNSIKDTSLSNEDITINKRIPNTGRYLFPPETFSPFKIKSSLNISIRLENRKRIKLNNKVYEINCASNSGLEFKIIEKF